MSQSATVDRILDAAEALFAERGFSETSLRMITSRAEVNLAAVNYHFGSKNALIQAVFSRFLDPLSEMIDAELSRVEAEHRKLCSNTRKPEALSVETLLTIVIGSIIRLPVDNRSHISIFMRLIGLAYTQSQAHLRKYVETRYVLIFQRFMRALKDATPELSKLERFWRIQFMIGAMAFSMSNSRALLEILKSDLAVDVAGDEILAQLVPFISAGMRASSDSLEVIERGQLSSWP